MSICGANVDSGANAEASEATGAWISVLGNLHISIWINGTAFIRPIAGLNGYLNSLLLTGDGPLRTQAKNRCVEVHGTLWIMDRIVEAGALANIIVAERLMTLLKTGRFLPPSECEKRLKKWHSVT